MKQCTRCNSVKSLSEFFADKRTKDKKCSHCKICHKSLAYATKKDHVRTLMTQIKHRAKLKNLPFNLTLEYVLSLDSKQCPVFGTKLLWASERIKNDPNSPSLDKISPDLGYVQGNVAFLSFRANCIKSDATAKELQQVTDWVLKHG
jgi:hypothetical protein